MRHRATLASLLLSSGIIGAANAQTVPAPADPTPQAQGDSTPREEHAGITEIVVTASRREENVQRTALSIQAISSESLTKAGVVKPEDLSVIAPGVSIASGGNYPQTYIRGIGNYATDSYAEGAVAYNLDGVYISRPWATRGVFYDLDRVEVLKGPQGTLYGRNASGGAVNIITARPKLDSFGGFVEAEAGNYNLFRGSAAINVPIGDTFAIRASGAVTSRDGYLTDGYDDDKEQSGRLQALWKPDDRLSILLSGGYVHIGGKGGGSVAVPALSGGNPWLGSSDAAIKQIFASEPGIGGLLTSPSGNGFVDIETYNIGAEISYDFGPATLTILPAYRDAKLSDITYVPGFYDRNHSHDQQTSVEARLSHASASLKWVLGGYYFDEDQGTFGGLPIATILQGVNAQTNSPSANTRSYAAFGQATVSLTSTLRLTGGLRYTYERKVQTGATALYGFPTPTGCAGTAVFDPATIQQPLFCRTDIPLVGRLTYNNVTFKAGAEFDLAAHSMAYVNVSTGFKSGGFFAAPAPNTFRPEKLTAFAAGIKNRFLDNRLQVNLETFFYRYRDHQEAHLGPTSLPGVFTFLTENAGRAESYGAALDLVYAATPHDRFSLLAQYNKSKYDTFIYNNPTAAFGPPVTGCAVGPLINGNQAVDCSGKQLVRAPTWSGSAGYSHTFALASGAAIEASGSVDFASSSYLSIDFLESAQQSTYAIGNVDLTYTPDSKRWSVTAYVHNVTDQAVYTQAFRSPFISAANPIIGGLNLGSIRPPRTVGARIRYNF